MFFGCTEKFGNCLSSPPFFLPGGSVRVDHGGERRREAAVLNRLSGERSLVIGQRVMTARKPLGRLRNCAAAAWRRQGRRAGSRGNLPHKGYEFNRTSKLVSSRLLGMTRMIHATYKSSLCVNLYQIWSAASYPIDI